MNIVESSSTVCAETTLTMQLNVLSSSHADSLSSFMTFPSRLPPFTITPQYPEILNAAASCAVSDIVLITSSRLFSVVLKCLYNNIADSVNLHLKTFQLRPISQSLILK